MSVPMELELWQCECFMCYPTPALRDECRANAHRVTECRQQLAQALEVLRAVEWQEVDTPNRDDILYACPVCHTWRHDHDGGHKADCKLAALIGAKVAE